MTHKIEEVARSIKNGDKIVLKYERPLKVLKKKTTRVFSKVSIIEFVYDERDYFTQLRETNGLNKQSEKEPMYKKIYGCLYKHIKSEKLYFRAAIPESKCESTTSLFEGTTEVSQYPKGHKLSKGKESIYDLLTAAEKPDYTCNDFQTSTGDAGHELEDRIRQMNYLIERIYELDIIG